MAGSTTTKSLYLQVGGDVTPLKALAKIGSTALLSMGADASTAQKQVREAFANMAPDPGSLSRLEASYNATFASIRRNAQSALGSGDSISALKLIDADGAMQSATAARAAATELRLAADAAALFAQHEAQLSDESRILIAGFETQAIEAARVAAALEHQADVMAGVAGEARLLGAAEDRITESHGRMGASSMIAEHVVRAFSDSVAAGQWRADHLRPARGRDDP